MLRRVEWVGQTSLLRDPRVEYALTAGQYSKDEARMIRDAARKRVMRVDGHTERHLTRSDIPGLTTDYVWGPHVGTFIVEMPEGDARLILGCTDGEQFRDVTPDIDEADRIQPTLATLDVPATLVPDFGKYAR